MGVEGGAAATALDLATFGSGVDGAGVGVVILVMTLATGVGVGSGPVPAGGNGEILANRDGTPAGGGPKTGLSTCGPTMIGGATGG